VTTLELKLASLVPADMAAGGCCDRGFVPEFLVSLADRAAVGNDHLPFEHPAEQVGHVPVLLLAHRPCQLERLSRDGDDPGVTVRLDDVMPHMRTYLDDACKLIEILGDTLQVAAN
jgi:hypothetical protein